MLIIDELDLSCNDRVNTWYGRTSELETTLTWLAKNTAMTLASLGSASLLDRNTDGRHASQMEFEHEITWFNTLHSAHLDQMILRSGFRAVSLSNIMRSSQNIAAATAPGSVNKTFKTGFKIEELLIDPGSSSSTVPGTRPRAILYKDTPDVDHNKLAGFVFQHLRTLPPGIKVAVLCDLEISCRLISDLLSSTIHVSCYQGGSDILCEEDRADDGGEAELCEWLDADHGILITDERKFRGCESDAVIFLKRWSGQGNDDRSPVTRAVAHLCLITSVFGVSVQDMRRYWDLEIME